ncbi:CAIB/BAIF family protein [Nitrospirillum viridazoti Y2]|uniref:Crotonobetainyl-CoA:carnitine CoA-transferase CaiB-like acyl-CoA transferase n=1 Tax=Nitrospirillum amazonense TaxID=28077 RepID=A0A560IKX5_9PROT|nr:CaiB/BaiF CoA-transferase family protein [Nitrospirillum amazonense]EGY02305.1 CAIB/BAIF family protein [Nitrospirillum amazonense Y2]TWB59692.1 crotonobetainyl-CoA:carnitine CoA-transferase CaiB-like acyl-CoA transferase [Nitrospirillum amazonense]
MTQPPIPATGPLTGLKVLDMSRVLAGPSATQILGDLGADVVKVERPGQGDDTRAWGPPFLKDDAGQDTRESAYYLSANRNKRSLTLDFTNPAGKALALQLIGHADVVVENYKTGTLDRYGLGYEDLRDAFPRLIYCSITGFGHTGPYAARAGYDYLVQGMGGFMSLTGEPEGQPLKAGVAIADLMTGTYAVIAILAALRHRDHTGRGQAIDLSLFDTQVAWLSHPGQYYLTSGHLAPRVGNAHPTIVPYQTFATSDGWIILAVGNDEQFARFCHLTGNAAWASDPRYATNQARVGNRDSLVPAIAAVIQGQSSQFWIDALEPLGVPCGPINSIDKVFADPQVAARGMRVTLPHPQAGGTGAPGAGLPGTVELIGSPMKFSDTPVNYRQAPPTLGQHTDAVLQDWLRLDEEEIRQLRHTGAL